MRHVALIACSSSKLDRAAAARDLYAPSDLFTKAMAWAGLFTDQTFILSALHGLVRPGMILEPYNARLPRRKSEQDDWALRVLHSLAVQMEGVRGPVVFHLLAGQDYREPLTRNAWRVFDRLGVEGGHGFFEPYAGLAGIGSIKAFLAESVRLRKPLAGTMALPSFQDYSMVRP